MADMPLDPFASHPLKEPLERAQGIAVRLAEHPSHREVLQDLKALDRRDLEAMALDRVYALVAAQGLTGTEEEHRAGVVRLARWFSLSDV